MRDGWLNGATSPPRSGRSRRGRSLSPFLKGLPDDRCPIPHYGFLFKGQMRIRYADREETVTAGQAFYAPSGHIPVFDEDCEMLEFSPTVEMQKAAAVIEKKLEAMDTQP